MLSCPPECAQVFFCPFAFPHFLSSFASKLPLAEPARSHKWSVTADTVVGFYALCGAQAVEPHQTTPAARRNHGSQESRPCRRFTPALSAIRKLATNGLGRHQLRCPRRGLMGRVVDTRKVASAGISVAIHSERFWPTFPSAYPTPRRPRPRTHAVYLRPIPDILRDPPMLSRVRWRLVVLATPTALLPLVSRHRRFAQMPSARSQ